MKSIIRLFGLLVIFSVSSISLAGDDLNLKEVKSLGDVSAAKMKPFIIGGNAGITFGDYTEIRLAPMVGYRFSPQIMGGVELVYRHSWDKQVTSSQENVTAQTDAIGGSAFIQYNPAKEFYLMTEYSYQSYTTETTQGDIKNDVPFWFVGLGYTHLLSPNTYVNAGLKVDVLNNVNSPFADFTPFFDVGIGVGI